MGSKVAGNDSSCNLIMQAQLGMCPTQGGNPPPPLDLGEDYPSPFAYAIQPRIYINTVFSHFIFFAIELCSTSKIKEKY